jgi:hypothetical protein
MLSFFHFQQIVSLVNGDKLLSSEAAVAGNASQQQPSNTIVDTYSAMGTVNGKQILANPMEIEFLQSHIQSLHHQKVRNTTSTIDLRKQIRHVEDILLTRHVGYLVGNQCMDYYKQDGITEIEEAISVNQIERRMNDMLLQQEIAGTVEIHRHPIYISTVSNFSNFLDLCRKALRTLELGIPIVVLCRTNYTTTQHSYRWVQLLIDLCCDVGIDASMITYVSASLSDVQSILQVCEHTTGNLYATCSRSVAADIMNIYPKTIASTSGPNTLVCTKWDNTIDKSNTMSKMAQAIADSATIESAGQCTALRHCVVPTTISDQDCTKILLDNITTIDSPVKALSEAHYAGIIVPSPSKASSLNEPSPTDDYQRLDTRHRHHDVGVYIKINNDTSSDSTNKNVLLTTSDSTIQEYWRQVVVDFTKLDLVQNKCIKQGKIEIRPVDEDAILKLASWLNIHQPISLAVNGPRHESIMVGIALWERTALVVYTLGSSDQMEHMPPALTCQARPQDGECFGEFPPRNTMHQYTNFPVIIPSSNPSYDTTYKEEYLQSRGQDVSEYMNKSTKNLLLAITNNSTRGYCVLLIEYLQNACRKNPKLGNSAIRTVLYGAQRPPLHMKTILRCTQHSTYDEFIPVYILFHVTNARNQSEISIHPDNASMMQMCQQLKLPCKIESNADFTSNSSNRTDIFQNVTITGMSLHGPPSRYPMVGNFVSLYLPFGHIKTTMVNDAEFEMKVRMSEKWLSTLF